MRLNAFSTTHKQSTAAYNGPERARFGMLPSMLPRIGGMATMPSRAASLKQALPAILAQVDRLYIYLDKHASVPPYLVGHDKIVPILPTPGDPSFMSSGKLLAISAHREPCLYFAFDDDITYPPDYVNHMVAALRRHRFQAVVGMHGAAFNIPPMSYTKDRQVIHFQQARQLDVFVDELGTGTFAFHSECLKFDIRQWEHHDMDDLMMMIECIRQDVTRVSVRRPQNYLLAIEQNQVDSLHRASLADDSRQTALLRATYACYPADWFLAG